MLQPQQMTLGGSYPRPQHCPLCISAEELELYSRGLDEGDSRVTNWVGATGGIGGRARGIHCEWLRPFARVEQAMAGVMGALGL